MPCVGTNIYLVTLWYNLTKLCFEVIQNGSKSNGAPGSNRSLTTNYWYLKSVNHVKLTEECVMYIEKHILVNRNVYKWAKHVFFFPHKLTSKRQSMNWKPNTDFSVKKKFWMKGLVKKVMLTVFYDIKGSITIDFLKKCATVNSILYYQLLMQNSPYLSNNHHIFM